MVGSEYLDCPIPREPPSVIKDKDITEKIGNDFRVLPTFEKHLFESKYKKYYSLHSNKLLHCRWRSYMKNYESREFAPFSFVDIRDFHFYSGTIRLLPEQSLHRTTNFAYKMGLGPGVDFRGQMPIPHDVMMKRGQTKSKERKIYPNTTKKGCSENKNKQQDK